MDALGPSTHSTRPKAKPVAKSQLSTATSKKSTESEYSITSSTSATFSNLTNSNSSSHLTLNQSNLANLNTRVKKQFMIILIPLYGYFLDFYSCVSLFYFNLFSFACFFNPSIRQLTCEYLNCNLI